MPLTLHPDMVSRKALAAGFGRENAASLHRRLAPFRSKQVALGWRPWLHPAAAGRLSPGAAGYVHFCVLVNAADIAHKTFDCRRLVVGDVDLLPT